MSTLQLLKLLNKMMMMMVMMMMMMMMMIIRFCHMPKEEHERHPMNQNILINHGMCTAFIRVSDLFQVCFTKSCSNLEFW